MGCSISCSTFEHFSTFIHWLVSQEHGSQNSDHYLDDFFFAGHCKRLMKTFDRVCERLGVPIAKEKTEGPMTKMEYLGLTLDTIEMWVKIPDNKVQELLKQINLIAYSKKVTLKQLQSLCGILAFCSRALPDRRTFSRRLYMATSKASKPYHYIRVLRNMFVDLMVWKLFFENFNGVFYILNKDWVSNVDLQLFTDSAGGGSTPLTCQNGCGVFFLWENGVIFNGQRNGIIQIF
jgi:hypothetical protein